MQFMVNIVRAATPERHVNVNGAHTRMTGRETINSGSNIILERSTLTMTPCHRTDDVTQHRGSNIILEWKLMLQTEHRATIGLFRERVARRVGCQRVKGAAPHRAVS
jgi:hypothetical protein